MSTKNPIQRCLDALNRDNERKGLPQIQVKATYLAPRSSATGQWQVLIIDENDRLVRFSFRYEGPVARLSDPYLLSKAG